MDFGRFKSVENSTLFLNLPLGIGMKQTVNTFWQIKIYKIYKTKIYNNHNKIKINNKRDAIAEMELQTAPWKENVWVRKASFIHVKLQD